MAGLEGEARRAAAGRLCVLRGYATGAVDEADADGEDALVRAAADGAVGAAGVRLLMEAGAASGGEALVAAATHGQREAAAGLIDNGVDVNSRAEKVKEDAAVGLRETQIEIVSIVTDSCQKWCACASEPRRHCRADMLLKIDRDRLDRSSLGIIT